MRCVHPVSDGSGRRVPCGRCISCRINRGQEWKDRLLHELDSWDCASFLTLTYNAEHYPESGSLVKDDLQKFFKRYRKWKGEDRIRYYAVGEYGDTTARAHYHAIVFGGKEDDDYLGCWKNGNIYVGSVTEQSIAYVTDYVNKKLYGEKAKKEYGKRLPPFSLMSKGMGKEWLSRNESFVLQNLGLKRQGRVYSMPRYYMKRLSNVFTDEVKNEMLLERSRRKLEMEAELGIDPLEVWKREIEERRQVEADQAFWESVRISKL